MKLIISTPLRGCCFPVRVGGGSASAHTRGVRAYRGRHRRLHLPPPRHAHDRRGGLTEGDCCSPVLPLYASPKSATPAGLLFALLGKHLGSNDKFALSVPSLVVCQPGSERALSKENPRSTLRFDLAGRCRAESRRSASARLNNARATVLCLF